MASLGATTMKTSMHGEFPKPQYALFILLLFIVYLLYTFLIFYALYVLSNTVCPVFFFVSANYTSIHFSDKHFSIFILLLNSFFSNLISSVFYSTQFSRTHQVG